MTETSTGDELILKTEPASATGIEIVTSAGSVPRLERLESTATHSIPESEPSHRKWRSFRRVRRQALFQCGLFVIVILAVWIIFTPLAIMYRQKPYSGDYWWGRVDLWYRSEWPLVCALLNKSLGMGPFQTCVACKAWVLLARLFDHKYDYVVSFAAVYGGRNCEPGHYWEELWYMELLRRINGMICDYTVIRWSLDPFAGQETEWHSPLFNGDASLSSTIGADIYRDSFVWSFLLSHEKLNPNIKQLQRRATRQLWP